MSVSVTLQQDRETVNNKYKVTNTITTSSGMEKEIFVKLTESLYYDHVATVSDMKSLGTDPDAVGAGYFRDLEFYIEFDDVSVADTHADGIKERLQTLVDDYNAAVNDFEGSEETTFVSV